MRKNRTSIRVRRAMLAAGLLAGGLAAMPAADAAFPGGNGRIVFQRSTGSSDVFSMEPDGSDQRLLTNTVVHDLDPEFSADGARVTFSGDGDIWVVNADGSGVRNVTNSPGVGDIDPVWSPDGTKIAFMSDRAGNADVYVINTNGTGEVRLTDHEDFDGYPAWSPNGQTIAFTSNRNPGGGTGIYTMNATSGEPEALLVNTSVINVYQDWSPDSSTIAYNSQGEITTIAASGGGPVKLTTGAQAVFGLSYSPDGGSIAYTSGRSGDNEVYVMPASGATLGANITNSPSTDDRQPDWGVVCQSCSGPIDLTTWTRQGPTANGSWTRASNDSEVFQSSNDPPSFFVSPGNVSGRMISSTVTVEGASGGDDFIGFVFGYTSPVDSGSGNPCDTPTCPNDYLLIDWKGQGQTFGGFTAQEGMAVTRVSGSFDLQAASSPTFWGHEDRADFDVLATDYGEGKGWRRDVPYRFDIFYSTDRLLVQRDGTTIFDIPGPHPTGRAGFYNYSQPGVRYSNVARQAVISGTSQNDSLTGTDGDDLIFGGGGDDVIDGGGGDDVIFGDGGDDIISGGDGNDTLVGESPPTAERRARLQDGETSNDTINGDAGEDSVVGGLGNDVLDGGAGNDNVDGDEGKDKMSGGSGIDVLHGLAGPDRVLGGPGNDKVWGEDADDRLFGNDGNDELYGLKGKKDICTQGKGSGRLHGCEFLAPGKRNNM